MPEPLPKTTGLVPVPSDPNWMWEPDELTITDWGMESYQGDAPKIDWLIEDVLPRATPGLVCSLGGVGKSYLMLDLSIRIAAGPGVGPQFALGGRIPKRGRVVFITAEDSQAAIHRRLDQLLSNERDKKRLLGQLFVIPLANTSGGTQPLMKMVNGEYQMTEAWWRLFEQIEALGDVALIILDPLQALVSADINADPAAAQAFWTSVGHLCAVTGAAVLATHHMRKDGSREIDGPMAAREAIRGTTALVDGCRWAWAGWLPGPSTRESIEQVIGEPMDELSIVQGAVVKSNDIGMSPTRTYIRDKVTGLLIDRTDQVSEELDEKRHLNEEQVNQTWGAVSTRWADGDPFSHHAASKSRYLGTWMVSHFDITKAAAREYIQQWIAEGRLVKEAHPSIRRAMGLRFQP